MWFLFMLPLFLLAIWLFVGIFLSNKIFYPKSFRLKAVLNHPETRERWCIGDKEDPGAFEMEFEPVEFRSKRPGKPLIHGWLIPGEGDEAIIMVHGRWSNRLKPLQYLSILKKQKRPILIFDLAGAGESEAAPCTMGIHESLDVDGALDFLHAKNIKSFILYAFSMGTAAAILSASRNAGVKKLILDSGFASASQVIIENAKGLGYPVWLTKIGLFFFFRRLKNKAEILETANKLKSLTTPTLVMHSIKDLYTPFDHALKLDKAGAHVTLRMFEKGEHVRIYFEFSGKYEKTVLNFLNEVEY